MTSAPQTSTHLEAFLASHAPGGLAAVLRAIAETARPLAHMIRRGGLAEDLDAAVGPAHDGVAQKVLDIFADEAFVGGLAPQAFAVSSRKNATSPSSSM